MGVPSQSSSAGASDKAGSEKGVEVDVSGTTASLRHGNGTSADGTLQTNGSNDDPPTKSVVGEDPVKTSAEEICAKTSRDGEGRDIYERVGEGLKKDGSGVETEGGVGTSVTDKDGSVLDENANVEVKVDKLQLNELLQDQDMKARAKGDKNGVIKGDDSAFQPDTPDDTSTARQYTGHTMSSLDGEEMTNGQGEEEEEEEPPEMTQEERKEMIEAVKDGDIDLLEDLLEKPNADIRMVYFDENLLMTALRAEQLEMAEFLLDNGVDHNFFTTRVHMGPPSNSSKASNGGRQVLELYQYSCRQMAYDNGYLDIVEIIDVLNDQLFPGVRARLQPRIPRLRRPPPTPTPVPVSSESEASSTSSSGDESDVSGDTEADQENAGLGAGPGGLSSSRTASLSELSSLQPVAPAQPTSKRKKKKAKTKKADGTGEDEGGTEGGGLPGQEKSETKKKRKKDLAKPAGAETDRTEESQQEGLSSCRRSEDSRGQGDLTDRSKATSKDSRATGEGEGEAGVHDEGYETMSPSPTHSPAARNQQLQQQAARFQPPSIPVKSTKAFLALRRTVVTHQQHCIPARYNEARPLHWKKVKTVGSYQAESPLWHRATSASTASSKLPPAVPSGTVTASSVSSASASATREAVSNSSRDSVSMVSTIEINSGNGTKPKILQPSQRAGSSKSYATTTATISSGGSCAVGLGSSASRASSSGDKLYPLKLKVPSYMRMTTSCYVKRRLEPNFANKYSALDFVEPGPKGFSSARGVGESVSSSGEGSSSSSIARKPATVPLTGRTAGGFTTVLDFSPAFCKRKAGGLGGSSGSAPLRSQLDSVPNVRNNSSVFHTPKLASVSSTVR